MTASALPAGLPSAPADDEDALVAAVDRWLLTTPSLPLPGGGETLDRWRTLAAIAAEDVSLAKVLEAHYDAQAILVELDAPAAGATDRLLAVWAAEPPDARVTYAAMSETWGTLSGMKAWCSGADLVDDALVTAYRGDERVLVRVALEQAGVSDVDDSWEAVGMSRVNSGRVAFYGARATPVGAPGAYLDRPGFWHGGAGIAACWYGGATAIADTLRRHPRVATDALMQAHLGVIDIALQSCRATLRQLAKAIDDAPEASHATDVTRARSLVERTCVLTMDRVGRALGAGPLCGDRAHALRCADLSVFIRQSHADRDWAGTGRDTASQHDPWTL